MNPYALNRSLSRFAATQEAAREAADAAMAISDGQQDSGSDGTT